MNGILKGSSKLFERKIHQIIFCITIIWVLFYFIFTIYLFPYEFTISTVWISTLGDPTVFSDVLIFNIGIFTTGLLLLYHFTYLFKSMIFRFKFIKYTIFSFLSSGAIGFLGISIFTDNIQPIHDISAVIAFLGLFLGYIGLDFYYGYKIAKETKLSSNIKLVWTGIIILSFVFLTGSVSYFIYGVGTNPTQMNKYILWEWLAFFAIGINIMVILLYNLIETKR